MSFYKENDPIQIYMKELKKAPTVEEEKEYLKEIKKGNKEAREEFLERNLRLVVSIAKDYIGQGLDFLDLIQEGNMGLIKALENFNPDLGYKFSTYATWWIKQNVIRGIHNDGDLIRKPVHILELTKKMMTKEKKLRNILNREPTIEEVAYEMNLSVEKVEQLRKLKAKPVSLDGIVAPNKGDEWESRKSKVKDFIENEETSSEEEVQEKELQKLVQKFLKKAGLTERERKVLLLRNGFKNNKIYTLEEIGLEEDVTRERIRQIEKKALKKLKESKYRLMFTDYVPKEQLNFSSKEKKI